MKSSLAIIGYGAIADEMVRVLDETSSLDRLGAILVRPARLDEARAKAAGRFPVVASVDELLQARPGIVAECAGHGAMRDYALAILKARVPLICSSVGVLADRAFADELKDREGLLIPSGAIAGIDGLLAARTAGLREASYASIKPPAAWLGTPAEAKVGSRRTVLFEGSARDAALAYPKNVNVGITVALAGLGMDRTRVSLVSDPEVAGPLGIIEAAGDFGTFRFEILAYASPRNPKTSLLTAHSIVAAAFSGVCFRATL